MQIRAETLAGGLVGNVDGDVTDMLPIGRLDQVDRAKAAAPFGDGARDVGEHSGTVLDLKTDDKAVGGREDGGHARHAADDRTASPTTH